MVDPRPWDRIYVAGAHSVGKTTLARWVQRVTGYHYMAEWPRRLIAEWEVSLDTMRVDVARTGEFQLEAYRRHVECEDALETPYLADRTALDVVAYTGRHTLVVPQLVAAAADYSARLREPRTLVLFVRPHPSLLAADGVRESPSWDEVVRVDAVLEFLFAYHGVSPVSLDSPSMVTRLRTVGKLRGV